MLNAQRCLRRSIIVTAAAAALTVNTAGPLATVSLAQEAPACQVNADFAPIVAKIGPATVGDCVSAELVGSSTGDRFQTTTLGLLILSSTGNWTAFTNGQTTWINNANGLATAGMTSQPQTQSQTQPQTQSQTQPRSQPHAPGQVSPAPVLPPA
jgi:hypothetical protein